MLWQQSAGVLVSREIWPQGIGINAFLSWQYSSEMNKATNNEVDLLLRKLARRERSGSTRLAGAAEHSTAQLDEQHLDANELNAYAENAIPPAPRARYTEHLADCAKCRKLVAQLSLASGSTVSPASVETKAPSGIKEYLAKFFTPPVLRYAGPAFALIAIVAIALILLRQKPSADYLAENQRSNTARTVLTKEVPPQPDTEAEAPAQKNGAVSSARSESKPHNAPPEERQQNEADKKTKALDSEKAFDKLQDSPAAPPDAQPAIAREQVSTTHAKIASANEAERTGDLAKQKKPASARDQAAESKEEDRRSDEVASTRSAPQKTEGLRPVTRNAQGAGVHGAVSSAAPTRVRAEKSSKDDDDGRTVVGHHFRKQGGVWVDTAYDSSRPTVKVARGSEQYQALVADEPAIRTIAEQLEGEVIVVWKGHAYRIR